MDRVAEVGSTTVADMCAAGADLELARSLRALADVYFGATAFTGAQRRAVAAARESGHTLGALQVIEHATRRVRSQAHKWKIREQLCATTGDAAALRAAARVLVRKLQGPPAPPEPGVRIRRRKDNVSELVITGPAADIAPMYDAVKDQEDRLAAFTKLVSGEGGVTTVLTPMVVLPMDKAVRIAQGDGEEIELDLTNGARISGADFARALLAGAVAEEGFVTLTHPVAGPVNTYHARFASFKQRIMAWAENPRCAWPECNRPAEECQIHHLESHARGGHTKPENLATCCAYHNGVNDDNPHAPPRRGRLERINGTVQWVWRTRA